MADGDARACAVIIIILDRSDEAESIRAAAEEDHDEGLRVIAVAGEERLVVGGGGHGVGSSVEGNGGGFRKRLLSPSLSSIQNGGEGARRAGEEVPGP